MLTKVSNYLLPKAAFSFLFYFDTTLCSQRAFPVSLKLTVRLSIIRQMYENHLNNKF